MQCKFYWQIGKQFFNLLIDFFMHIFQLNFCFVFFWLTHELKFGSFQASFLLTLWGAFRIWKFCDFACIFFMFLFGFSFLFSYFFWWYCLVLVNFEFQIRVRQIRLVIWFSIGFWFDLQKLFTIDFDLGFQLDIADKFGFFAGCSGEFSEFCFCTEWDELIWVWVLNWIWILIWISICCSILI